MVETQNTANQTNGNGHTPDQYPTPEQVYHARIKARDQQVTVYALSGQPGYQYAVPSESLSGHAYLVSVQDPDLGTMPVCQCKGWQYRGICKHAGAVLNRLEAEAELRSWSVCQRPVDEDLEDKLRAIGL